jgi:hypothetical protein
MNDLHREKLPPGRELELAMLAKSARRPKKGQVKPMTTLIGKPRELAETAPAPRLGTVVAQYGSEPTRAALAAWEARLQGTPMVDIAHAQGLSIEACKQLLREAHDAVKEDLKEALEMNRQLDLGRLDGLIKAYYAPATQGEQESAYIVLAALKQRAKLTGVEEPADPLRSRQPQNILVWIQNALPSINKIVDALPNE